jgi:hypothetical protein
MTYPAALLCHNANLQTSTIAGSATDWGAGAGTPVYTVIKCRFGTPQETYNLHKSGERLINNPVCIVPAGTAAVEGNKLIGVTAPFDKTYIIKEVKPAMLASSISHLILSIEAVE